MKRPRGLSFYRRLEVGRFISFNPSTNGLSVSIGIPGARFIIPLVTFSERPPMVNVQKYGIRYRRHLVSVESLLDEAKETAAEDLPAAAKIYRRAARYAHTDDERAEVWLGKGYTGKRMQRPLDGYVDPEDYFSLGAIIRGDYQRFLDAIGEIRKREKK